MRYGMVAVALGFAAVSASLDAAPRTEPVSSEDAVAWIRHAVPLPKQIEIAAKAVVPAAEVQVSVADNPDAVVAQAVKELMASLGQAAGRSPMVKPTFFVNLAIARDGAAPLRALKNADQAYRIEPDLAKHLVELHALTPRGLYYAAKTLQQLIRARAKAGVVEIPLVRVTDWPDMEDRGLWGADNYAHLKWLGERKMNIVEQISDIGVDEQGRPYARLKSGREPMVTEGPLYGIKPVPAILHLEQVSGKGVFRAYPELQGQGGQEGCICYSQPAIVDVLAGWIVELRKLPYVEDVDVWMAENLHGKGGCQCAECRQEDRSVLEAHVIVAAWKKAQEQVGKVGIRILTSEETELENAKVILGLPKELKVWYYHSLLTYTSGHSPMVRKYLQPIVKRGHWIGMCPNLVAAVHFAEPFTGGQFIHARMNEFVDKGMSGLIGYVVPRVYYALFNTEAAAEWSWNAKGRSPREFALSWAVRRGMKEPEKFADWADTMGPVAWDVYGSDWPSGEQRNVPGKVAGSLKTGKLPELGSVLWGVYRAPWGDIKSPEQLDRDVAQAERAVAMAKGLEGPEFLHESMIVEGYIRSLKALWELKKVVKSGRVAEADKAAAKRYFRMYVDSLGQAAATLPKWEATLPHRPASEDFTSKPVGVIRQAVDEMKKVAAELGCGLNEGH